MTSGPIGDNCQRLAAQVQAFEPTAQPISWAVDLSVRSWRSPAAVPGVEVRI